jgi:serine/threonine-protein kinase RsbW
MTAKLELKVEMAEIKRVRDFALSIADEAGLDELQSFDLHLIVEEAVTNIINYSGATMMELNAWTENSHLYVSFTDDGIAFDPTQYPSPDLTVPASQRRIGGLGVYYIRMKSDSMVYRREDERNILTIGLNVKRLEL